MRISVGNILTGAGAAVALFGAVSIAIGLKFSTPGGLLTIAVYKGIFAAAAGLMIVGAFWGRHAIERRKEKLEMSRSPRLDNPPVFDEFDLRETERQTLAERIDPEP